jgi:hypothetical protein
MRSRLYWRLLTAMSFAARNIGRTTRRLAIAVLSLAVMLPAFSSTSHAAPITFAYEGIVDSTTGGAVFDAFQGETLRIQYTYDSDAIDNNPVANQGAYAGISLAVSVTGGYAATLGFDLTTVDDAVADDFAITSNSALPGPHQTIDGLDLTGFLLTITAIPATMFTDDSLPLFQPFPNLLSTMVLTFSDGGANSGTIQANTVTVADVVPEPGALVIFSLGLAGLGFTRRRRNAS